MPPLWVHFTCGVVREASAMGKGSTYENISVANGRSRFFWIRRHGVGPAAATADGRRRCDDQGYGRRHRIPPADIEICTHPRRFHRQDSLFLGEPTRGIAQGWSVDQRRCTEGDGDLPE